jgi:hypothetical protein
MKKMTIALSTWLLAALFVLSAQAQHEAHHRDQAADRQPSMHHDEMMHRMMADPEHRMMMAPCLLPELADELELSADQVERLESLRAGVMASDPEQMHQSMQDAASEVGAVLDERQMARFHNMDAEHLHRVMMSNPAMMEHMHSMAKEGMECPMMMSMKEDRTDAGHDH